VLECSPSGAKSKSKLIRLVVPVAPNNDLRSNWIGEHFRSANPKEVVIIVTKCVIWGMKIVNSLK